MIGLLLGGKMNRGTIWRYKIGKGMLIQGINMYDALRPSKKKCTMHYETPKENKENPQSTIDKTINYQLPVYLTKSTIKLATISICLNYLFIL